VNANRKEKKGHSMPHVERVQRAKVQGGKKRNRGDAKKNPACQEHFEKKKPNRVPGRGTNTRPGAVSPIQTPKTYNEKNGEGGPWGEGMKEKSGTDRGRGQKTLKRVD